MRGKFCLRSTLAPGFTTFNEARALCAGSCWRTAGGNGDRKSFNEARALCAGSCAVEVITRSIAIDLQ